MLFSQTKIPSPYSLHSSATKQFEKHQREIEHKVLLEQSQELKPNQDQKIHKVTLI